MSEKESNRERRARQRKENPTHRQKRELRTEANRKARKAFYRIE